MHTANVVLVVSLLLASAAHAADITSCGEVVRYQQTGVLKNDLECLLPETGVCEVDGTTPCSRSIDCPSGNCLGVAAVVMERNTTLDLNGFKIESGFGVECTDGRCRIQNGLIAGTSGATICIGVLAPGTRIALSDVDINGNGCSTAGILNVSGKTKAVNLSIEDGSRGITTYHLRGENINVSNNSLHGLFSHITRVKGLTVNGNGLGNNVGNFRGVDVVANGNGDVGLLARRFRGTNVEASNNAGPGVHVIGIGKINGFTALQNDGPGFRSEESRGVLVDATITSTLSTYDIESARRTTLRGNSSCDRSLDTSTNGTWGICALD